MEENKVNRQIRSAEDAELRGRTPIGRQRGCAVGDIVMFAARLKRLSGRNRHEPFMVVRPAMVVDVYEDRSVDLHVFYGPNDKVKLDLDEKVPGVGYREPVDRGELLLIDSSYNRSWHFRQNVWCLPNESGYPVDVTYREVADVESEA